MITIIFEAKKGSTASLKRKMHSCAKKKNVDVFLVQEDFKK